MDVWFVSDVLTHGDAAGTPREVHLEVLEQIGRLNS